MGTGEGALTEASLVKWFRIEPENPLAMRFERLRKAGWAVPESDEQAVE